MTLIKTRARGLKLDDNFAFTGTVSGAGGMSEAVVFRMSSGVSGNADPITTWEVADDAMAGRIGTGITQSRGIFSFGSTGIYLIEFQGSAYDSGTDDLQVNLEIHASSNSGGAYDRLAQAMTNLHNASQNPFSINALVDITDTSNQKVKFDIHEMNSNNRLLGSTNARFTGFTFLRLGDT